MDVSGINLTLNLIGTLGVIASFIFIVVIKLHLKHREELLNKKLEDLLILTDKLIEHAEDIKDQGIVLDQKEIIVVPRETTSPDNSRSKL